MTTNKDERLGALVKALDGELGANSAPATPDERLAAIQARFNKYRKALLIGKGAVALGVGDESLALTALDDLAKLLRSGRIDQPTLNMLAYFVEDVADKSATRPKDFDEQATLAFRILEHQKKEGSPNKELARVSAIDTFIVLRRR